MHIGVPGRKVKGRAFAAVVDPRVKRGAATAVEMEGHDRKIPWTGKSALGFSDDVPNFPDRIPHFLRAVKRHPSIHE
jgi:hypothetical protein